MIEIKIPAVSYKDFEIIEGLSDTIILHDKYMQVVGKGSVKKMNEDLGMPITQEYDYSITVFKDQIKTVEAGYSTTKEIYEVDINSPSLVTIIAPSRKFCFDLAKQIVDWKNN